jgi:hypothetical protein
MCRPLGEVAGAHLQDPSRPGLTDHIALSQEPRSLLLSLRSAVDSQGY